MTALGVVITSELLGLESLAAALNGRHPTLAAIGRKLPEQAVPAPFLAQGAALVTLIMTSGKDYPEIPIAAIAPFNALAAGLEHHYEAIRFDRTGRIGVFPIFSGRHMLVAMIETYVNNRQRDRLRRCPQCARWFVDRTRNKAAQRCSRACTIAWSNAQRPKKETPHE